MSARERPSRASRRRAGPGELVVCFLISAGIPIYLALRGGGYDPVVYQEAGLVVWWVLAVGFLFGFLPRTRSTPTAKLVLGCAGLLAAWTLMGLAWSGSAELTFAEGTRTIGYLGLLLLVISTLSSANWRAAAWGLAAALLSLPVFSLLSRLAPGAFPPDEVARVFGGDRLSYPLGYWNAVASMSAMAIGVGLAISAHDRRGPVRALALASVPVSALALYLTYSRGGIAAAALAALVCLYLARSRLVLALHAVSALAAASVLVLLARQQPAIAHGTSGTGGGVVAVATLLCGGAMACLAVWTGGARSRSAGGRSVRNGVAAAAAILAILAVVAAVALTGSLEVTGSGSTGLDSGPAGDDPAARLSNLETPRWDVWSSALRAFEAHPLEGLGAGTFRFWWVRDGAENRLIDAHSLYVEDLAELGLPGLLLILALVGALGRYAWLGRRAASRHRGSGLALGMLAAFAAYAFHAGIDWLWEVPAVTAMGLGAALVAGGAAAAPRRARRTAAGGLLAFVAILAGAAQVPGILGTERTRTGTSFLAAGLENDAVRFATEAISAEPWSSSAYSLRGEAELASGRLRLARADVEAAIDREPASVVLRLQLARVETRAGRIGAAVRAVDGIRELLPRAGAQLDAAERKLRSLPGR